MSADEWAICPICRAPKIQTIEKEIELGKSTGEITLRRLGELESELKLLQEPCVRMDNIRARFDDTKMVCHATAVCKVCGASWQLNVETGPKK